jgi:UDP-N-acetylmuramyl pentapeptide phosphotransferase/UDP-N-acetylglucosamine-1-phosphate transferase
LTGEGYENGVACFIPVVFLLSQRSNGANLTDGIDGLAGTSAISVLALGFLLSFLETLFF